MFNNNRRGFKIVLKYLMYSLLLLSLSRESETVLTFKECFSSEIYENILKIFNIFIPDSLVSIILHPGYFSCQLKIFTEEIFGKHQIIITQPKAMSPLKNILIARPDTFVIFIDHYQTVYQLESIVTSLQHRTQSWNPDAKFLLITSAVAKSYFGDSHLAMETFNFLWNRNVLKVQIVVWGEENFYTQNISVFSSAPYSKLYGTCKEIKDTKQLHNFNLSINKLPNTDFSGFKFENSKYFAGCPITAHTVDSIPPYTVAEKNGDHIFKSGIEIQLLKLLAELYNFSLRISSPKEIDNSVHLYFLTNGTSTGLLEDLINYKIELVFGGMKPPANNHLKIDITQTYGYTSINWFVPDGEKADLWNFVLDFLSGTTWLVLFLIFVSFSLLYYVMTYLREKNNYVFFYLVGVLLGTSFNRPPQSYHLRIMLVSWYLFSMHVTTMFSTNLYRELTHPPMDPGIQTVRQLYQSSFNICIPQSWKQKYQNVPGRPLISDIFRTGMICNNLEKAVERLIEKRNFGIIAKVDHMNSLVDEKEAKIHKLDIMYSYPVGMTLSKGSILRGLLNQIIIDSTEAGLLEKWKNDVRSEIKVKFNSNKTVQSDCKSHRFGKDEFIWICLSLLIGHLVACLGFIVEIIYSKFDRFRHVN